MLALVDLLVLLMCLVRSVYEMVPSSRRFKYADQVDDRLLGDAGR